MEIKLKNIYVSERLTNIPMGITGLLEVPAPKGWRSKIGCES
ncbi:MAG TPA: hypothetical protein VN616_14545 [Puia sp.]|nr:hypothetical protein [Puia sp.]